MHDGGGWSVMVIIVVITGLCMDWIVWWCKDNVA
jgi:hypothetical protein